MTSIKVKFRPSTVSGQEGAIYYQITHERKIRQLAAGYKVFTSEWDESRSMVAAGCCGEQRPVLPAIRDRIRWDLERLTKIVRRLDANGLKYTADDVIDEFNRYAREYSLFNYMESIIARLKQNGKLRTSETYRSTLNSFKKFRQQEDIMLDCLNSGTMEAYEGWLKGRGVAPNTVSFYTRILRAVLKKTDLKDGYVTYRRRKTGQRLVIEWTREMQRILDKYPANESCYLLPVIRRAVTNERSVYRNAAYNINHNLKRIAPMAGVTIPLTLYVARHSWASAAKAKGIPVSVISEGMGHDSEATTQIYLAALDTSAVDRANTIILKSLR